MNSFQATAGAKRGRKDTVSNHGLRFMRQLVCLLETLKQSSCMLFTVYVLALTTHVRVVEGRFLWPDNLLRLKKIGFFFGSAQSWDQRSHAALEKSRS
jgi:hypothetical protein